MTVTGVGSECVSCILDKYLTKYPTDASEEQKLSYMKSVLRLLADLDGDVRAPEAVAMITQLQREMFGVEDNFAKEKDYFNRLMLRLYPKLQETVDSSENPLYTAVCFALAGNFIDFGAMKEVDEDKLFAMLEDFGKLNFSKEEFENFTSDITNCERLVYLTDNCGEIVTDKLLISVIKKLNPNLIADAIVRGAPVLNDATMSDAVQVGLMDVVNVVSNGTAIAGTCPDKISAEAKELFDRADVIISKGQGNFETLFGCGKNVYYLFLCKCNLFAQKFGVEKYTEMFMNELRK